MSWGVKTRTSANPHGLHDDDHYTTARDLVRISQAALKSETFKQITNTATYIMPATNLSAERELTTTNQLIRDDTSNGFYYEQRCRHQDRLYQSGGALPHLHGKERRDVVFERCVRRCHRGRRERRYCHAQLPGNDPAV